MQEQSNEDNQNEDKRIMQNTAQVQEQQGTQNADGVEPEKEMQAQATQQESTQDNSVQIELERDEPIQSQSGISSEISQSQAEFPGEPAEPPSDPEPAPLQRETQELREAQEARTEAKPSAPASPKPVDEIKEMTDDEEILKFIEETKQKIYIVGAGGSGSNTLDRLFELGTTGASLVAMNTDAKHLLKTRSNRKIILGKKVSRGRGAGSNPQVGEKSAQESLDEIKSSIGDGSLVFITCGLGGGTGTGSAPVIAEAAKAMGALTVAVVTLPFTSEGKIRMENALQGMEKLRKHTDTLIVIKNDKLLNLVPDLPLNTAFKVCDEVLAGSVKGIAELVTKSGLVNVDFADLRTILSGAGYAAIGLGEASLDAKQEDRARVAVETALSSPLLDADISSSTRALINVIGGEDMTLKEAEFIVAETSKRINQNAHIIWGARVEENIKKSSMRVLVVLAGVKFPKYEYQPKDADMEELDLDLIG